MASNCSSFWVSVDVVFGNMFRFGETKFETSVLIVRTEFGKFFRTWVLKVCPGLFSGDIFLVKMWLESLCCNSVFDFRLETCYSDLCSKSVLFNLFVLTHVVCSALSRVRVGWGSGQDVRRQGCRGSSKIEVLCRAGSFWRGHLYVAGYRFVLSVLFAKLSNCCLSGTCQSMST